MRLLVLAGGLAAAVILFLLLRPSAEESGSAPPTANEPAPPPAPASAPASTESAPAETTPPAPPPPPPSPPKPAVATIRITIRGGTPEGGVRRASVRKGGRVRLVVRSDVADHVHLHGYDVFRDVAPGKPAQLAFRATIAGRFEIELEDRGLQIAELEVRP